MKAMKIALLGTAALAAASVSARADSTSDLKAQIEALNARVATLETTPAMPAGYSMVSFTKEGNNHVITIMPTADAPAAAATVVTWSGYVRAAVVSGYSGNPAGNYATDIRAKAGFNVTGKTDTAVGEVGVSISTQASTAGFAAYNVANPVIQTDGFSGWWKITPNFTLTGGVLGTLSKSGYSFDANCTCAFNDSNASVISGVYGGGDPAAMKLSYADGPLSFAMQVEDANNAANASAFGVSGKIGYSGDMFGADVDGGYWGNANSAQQAAWAVSTGIGGKFGMFSMGVAAGLGSGILANDDYTKVSGYAKAALSDSMGLELGVTHQWNTQLSNGWTEFDGGVYYTPVKQLTFGIEGEFDSADAGSGKLDGNYTAAFLTIFKF